MVLWSGYYIRNEALFVVLQTGLFEMRAHTVTATERKRERERKTEREKNSSRRENKPITLNMGPNAEARARQDGDKFGLARVGKLLEIVARMESAGRSKHAQFIAVN